MLASLLWLVPSWMISPSFASHPVTVTGVLKGYFLSPDGTLKVREVPFAFPEKPTVSDLPDRLFPLPAGYYLQGKFSSSEPIQSVWLLSGNGRLLWRRHYPEGVLEEDMPYQVGGWIGLRGEDGLSVRLLVRFVDGKETVIRPRFPVRFERVLPLKVDWLDFVRIAEVAHLLKEKGKEIWEGFSLDSIPFLLEGAEGQWVLINHPKPPKGFERYEGPLPKVSFPMTVYVGQQMSGEMRREEVMGWAEKVNGVWVAGLRYFPHWWVLTDCASEGYPIARQPDALQRLEAIIHEAFHVWWFQRIKVLPNATGSGRLQAAVAKLVEQECMARALEAEDEEEKRLWVKAFLEQRKKRRHLEGANEEQIIFERWRETIEGIATYVGKKALKVAKESDYQPTPEVEWDKEFSGYWQDLDESVLAQWVRRGGGEMEPQHVLGLAHVLFLSRWDTGWQRQVMKGKSLEELLEARTKEVVLPSDLLASLEEQVAKRFKEAIERSRGHLRNAHPPEPSVPIWFYLPELVKLAEQFTEQFGNPLFGLNFSLPEMDIRLSSPVWVKMEPLKKRVGILWDARKQLIVLYRPKGMVELKGDGLTIRGYLKVTWDKDGVHVHPDSKPQKTKGGASTMMRKKAWYAVVLPLALLTTSFAAQTTFAVQDQNEEEEISVSGTLSGLFYDGVSGQFQYAELALDDPTISTWYFIDEEETTLHLTVLARQGNSFYQTDATFYITLSFSIDDNWQFQGIGFGWQPRVQEGPRSGRDKVNVEIIINPDGSVTIKVTITKPDGSSYTFTLLGPSVPPPGTVTVTAVLGDAEKIPDARALEGRTSANGEIWRRSKPGKRFAFSCSGQVNLQNIPVADDYTGKATRVTQKRRDGQVDNSACLGPVTSQPVQFDVRPQANHFVFFIFWQHKGVRGKVRVETPFGINNPVEKIAEVCLARQAREGEIPDFEIQNEDGTKTGYVKIETAYANQNIRQGSNQYQGINWVEAEFFLPYPDPKGGLYDLFVFLIADSFPIPSNYRWSPSYGWSVVSVPECEYSRPLRNPDNAHDSFNSCSQSVTKDIGLVVTFRPVEGGDDGIESPIGF
ncbi:MAG: hypothetical protein YYHSYBAR_000316 [Candidatus Fervidibacter sacchari]